MAEIGIQGNKINTHLGDDSFLRSRYLDGTYLPFKDAVCKI